ncbi:SPOR domain-containing protein [Mycoplana ramosa]|uniref:SPOR domain-containing protein n=1 Tax=Mycoplana ramosa TaxID=40837 RepID=A0ABW3YTH8_MYCRA
MADNNLARSGAADIGLLSDDDPLAELARIVGYEPRNVPTTARPVPPEPLVEPVFDLESELLREFARYDAPPLDPVADVDRGAATGMPGDGVLSVADLSDAAVSRSDVHSEATRLPIADRSEPLPAAGSLPSDEGLRPIVADNPGSASAAPAQVPELSASDVEWWPVATPVAATPVPAAPLSVVAPDASPAVEPVFLGLQPAEYPEAAAEPAPLDLDRELELSLGDVLGETPDVSHVRPQTHSAETPRLSDAAPSYDAAAAGLVAGSGGANASAVSGSTIDSHFTVDVPDRVVADLPPLAYSEPLPVVSEGSDGAHFEAAELPVEVGSVDFVPAWMPEQQVDAPLAIAEDVLASSAADTAAETIETFEPASSYEVAPAARAATGYEFDELLAEVERFPVPENLAPVATPLQTPRPRAGSLDGFSSIKFGRATPVALDRQQASAAAQPMPAPVSPVQVVAPAEPTAAPAVGPMPDIAAPRPVGPRPAEPVNDYDAAVAADAVEDAFANFEIDFSDVEFDLDPSDLVLGDEAKPAAAQLTLQPAPGSASISQAKTVGVAAVPAPPVSPQAQQARFEPALPVEAAETRAPEPLEFDGALPFDPSLIAETDTSVAPVAELDVPQLPAIEKEKPPVHPPEFDFDIDAEMAQLFANPAAGEPARGAERAGTAAPAATAAKVGSVETDEFDKALEEDLRRSLSQSERHAIPLDAQQVDGEYLGDGYDEPVRRGKGMLVAAAAALVVLGGAGVYAFMASSGVVGTGSGEPRVILADKEPVKIVPEEKGGKTVPNQDKAVYDRVAGASEARPQQEQLVTSTEEPVDVVQRTLAPESLPFDGPEDEMPADDATAADDRLLPGVDDVAADAGHQEDRSPIVSPRKVRTMIVKPDGTLVAREEPVTEPESALASPDNAALPAASNSTGETASAAGASAVPSATAEAGLRAERAGEVAAAADENASALQQAANVSVADSAPVGVVGTTTPGAVADAPAVAGGVQTTGTVANGAPVPVTRPADQPVNVVGTVTERGRVSEASPTETASLASDAAAQTGGEQPAAVDNPGGYVIQIASLPSAEEAQKSYQSLSAKFSGVIGGRGVDIKRADIPNKGTYFRVRIPAGSREEANALCAKYKSAGGSCLVTR